MSDGNGMPMMMTPREHSSGRFSPSLSLPLQTAKNIAPFFVFACILYESSACLNAVEPFCSMCTDLYFLRLADMFDSFQRLVNAYKYEYEGKKQRTPCLIRLHTSITMFPISSIMRNYFMLT